MAKTKISEFSTTPGNNTDINGINISEGCAPSGINNAIRELMSDLKEWQSGAMDVYVIPQGTAAAPGIQLYGDLDTGLYGFAANQLGVAVGGASAGYFSSAGWVGNVNGTITGDINATTIDTTNLEVTNIKAKDGTAAITIANSTGVVSVSTTLDLTTVEVTNIKAKDGTAAIALTDSTGVVTLARTTSATNSVNEMLVLEHYSTGTISAGFGSGIKFFGENTGGGNSVYAAIHAVWEGGIGDPSGGALVFLTDGYVGDNTERVRITSEGKVGIGTATPSTTLEVSGSATVTGATTLSATTQNIALGTSQTTGTWTAGGASQTGALTLDQSTKTHTLNLGTGATESGLTKTVNIGTGGVSTSTTTITIGSANGTSTTLNGTVTAATLNSTTIDTTNIEVTNIKAKDGSASATIADSTGVMTIASSVLTTTDINGGTIDGTTIGGSTAAAGTFTTATATTGNITTVNATTVDTTNIEVTNIKAKDGTAALSIADSTGVVSVSANPVLSAGTANGVAFLNGSNVLTTGSALTFDGTRFGVNGGLVSDNNLVAQINSPTSSAKFMGFNRNGDYGLLIGYDLSNDYASIRTVFDYPIVFSVFNAEKMRLTSTGLKASIAGTNADPVFSYTSDTNTGIFFPAADKLGFVAGGGADQMVLTSTGLGIGTSSPSEKLEVSASNAMVKINGSGSFAQLGYYNSGTLLWNAYADISSGQYRLGNSGGTQLTLTSSGNLGLGVTPSANSGRLQVQGENATTSYAGVPTASLLDGNANGEYSILRFATSSDGSLASIAARASTGGAYPSTVGALEFAVQNGASSTLAMTLDASGNLGIGETSPSTYGKITLKGGKFSLVTDTAAERRVSFWSTANGNSENAYIQVQNDGATTNTGEMLFATKNSGGTLAERARITSGGYFKASDNGTYLGSTGTYHEFNSDDASNATLVVRSTSASFVANTLQLRVVRNTTNGTFFPLRYYNEGAGADKFLVADSGNVTNTNGSYGTISDAKMKTDIVDAGSQWSDIKALRFRKFKMKNDPSGLVQLGVVAQEVELTSPGLVDEHADKDAEGNDLGTTTKSVKTSVLLMKAAVALQEAMARIEKLEAEVAALKGA